MIETSSSRTCSRLANSKRVAPASPPARPRARTRAGTHHPEARLERLAGERVDEAHPEVGRHHEGRVLPVLAAEWRRLEAAAREEARHHGEGGAVRADAREGAEVLGERAARLQRAVVAGREE